MSLQDEVSVYALSYLCNLYPVLHFPIDDLSKRKCALFCVIYSLSLSLSSFIKVSVITVCLAVSLPLSIFLSRPGNLCMFQHFNVLLWIKGNVPPAIQREGSCSVTLQPLVWKAGTFLFYRVLKGVCRTHQHVTAPSHTKQKVLACETAAVQVQEELICFWARAVENLIYKGILSTFN